MDTDKRTWTERYTYADLDPNFDEHGNLIGYTYTNQYGDTVTYRYANAHTTTDANGSTTDYGDYAAE